MVQKIAVVGSGTMGNGIAHVFAQFGFSVNLIDQQPAQLEKALQTIRKNMERQSAKGIITAEQMALSLGNISTYNKLESGVQDVQLVIEAATENAATKLNIFRDLDKYTQPGALLASNTSSISITQIAAATQRPEKVIGMHFMNPVPVMKLVEIIKGYVTSDATINTITDLARQINKVPCLVNDYPGFIANRILMPMINEAIYSLQEGVAGVESIDTIMMLGMAHPMGPLRLADFIGLDVCHSILSVLFEGFGNSKYAPCVLLTNMVNAGKLGVKSGEGFYIYSRDAQPVVSPAFPV